MNKGGGLILMLIIGFEVFCDRLVRFLQGLKSVPKGKPSAIAAGLGGAGCIYNKPDYCGAV